MNRRDIDALHSAGLITDEQRKAIIKHNTAQPPAELKAPNRGLILFLSTLAVILIVSGAIVLISTHWHEITPFMKASAGILIMLLAWIGCWRLREKKPGVAEALGLLGACMWGVNLMLHGVLFEPDTPAVESAFIFFIGLLPIPFLLRQRVLIGVVALYSFFLLTLMLIFPEPAWLSLSHLSEQKGVTLILYATLAILWWLVGEKCRRREGVCEGYYWIAAPSFIAFLSIMQAALLYSSGVYQPHMGSHLWWLVAALPLPVGILLLKEKGRRPRLSHILLLASTVALLPIAVYLSYCPTWHEVAGLLVCSAYALVLTAAGIRCGRKSWANYSAILMGFVFINLLYHIGTSLTDAGLIIMATGFSVLAFAFLLEGHRRRIIKKITANTPPTSTTKA